MKAAYLCSVLLFFSAGCQGGAVQREKPLVYRDLSELLSGDCRALADAAASGDLKKITRLISGGTDVSCSGYYGVTPLYWATAARSTNRAGLEALLKAGANPNQLVADGTPLVHIAAMRGDEASWVLETLLRYGGDPNAVAERGGTSPLFAAENHAAVVTLVEAGADINFVSEFKRRPVSSLAARNQYESVYYLLRRGADWQVPEFINVTRNIASRWDTRSPQYAWYVKTVDYLRAKGAEI